MGQTPLLTITPGKEVITHTDPVTVPGWIGAGYIIQDPATGAGAYKINGGENGGFFHLGDAFVDILTFLHLEIDIGGTKPSLLTTAFTGLFSVMGAVISAFELLEDCGAGPALALGIFNFFIDFLTTKFALGLALGASTLLVGFLYLVVASAIAAFISYVYSDLLRRLCK